MKIFKCLMLLVLQAALACSGNIAAPALDDSEPEPGPAVRGPVVTGVAPTTLPPGSTVDLHVFGSGFDAGSRVGIFDDGVPTPKVQTNGTRFVSPRELVASVTTAADAPEGPYDIGVAGGNGKQGVGTELVDVAAVVSGVQPFSVNPGDSVTISGIGFGSNPDRVHVTISGTAAEVVSLSNTTIVLVVPASLPEGSAIVEVNVGGTPARPAPVLSVIHPPAALDPHINLVGVYDLTALITNSDPAWGIEDGTRQTAVITIQHSRDPARFVGTFTDFRAIAPGGESYGGNPGSVSATLDLDGRVIIELFFEGSQTSYWYGEGMLTSRRIAGEFGAGGHITGTFIAERRQAD